MVAPPVATTTLVVRAPARCVLDDSFAAEVVARAQAPKNAGLAKWEPLPLLTGWT